jgi:hypothetical protein
MLHLAAVFFYLLLLPKVLSQPIYHVYPVFHQFTSALAVLFGL